MSLGTFSYTPGREREGYEDSSIANDPEYQTAADAAYQRAMTWRAPSGHASWCWAQQPPEWRTGHLSPYAGTPNAAKGNGCGCGRNALARSLRKLATLGAIPVDSDSDSDSDSARVIPIRGEAA